MRDRFFLGCCWAGGWVCGATVATGGAWAAGTTAGGVVGVKGEVGAAGVGVAGLRPLLYIGALCLNCAGRAGLGALGSSGGRPASREDGAVSRTRPEGPAGLAPPQVGRDLPYFPGTDGLWLQAPGPLAAGTKGLKQHLQGVRRQSTRGPQPGARGLRPLQTRYPGSGQLLAWGQSPRPQALARRRESSLEPHPAARPRGRPWWPLPRRRLWAATPGPPEQNPPSLLFPSTPFL